MTWEGGVGGKVGEENLMFIGKKKLERWQQLSLDPRPELAKMWCSREALPGQVCTEWGCPSPQFSLHMHLSVPPSPSHPTSSLWSLLCHYPSGITWISVPTGWWRHLLRQQDCSSWIPLNIDGSLSAQYQLHDNGVV